MGTFERFLLIMDSINPFNLQEIINVKCDNFPIIASESFSALRKEEDFFDVTLVTDDEQEILAHKLILSASSLFFKRILKKSKQSHPMICLEGISSSELQKILNYIYIGEVEIFRNDIQRFFHISKRLKLQGLFEKNYDNFLKMPSSGSIKSEHVTSVSDLQPHDEKKSKLRQQDSVEALLEPVKNEKELDNRIEKLIVQKTSGRFNCRVCLKQAKVRANMDEHVETHFNLEFKCEDCDNVSNTRKLFRVHERESRHGSFKEHIAPVKNTFMAGGNCIVALGDSPAVNPWTLSPVKKSKK